MKQRLIWVALLLGSLVAAFALVAAWVDLMLQASKTKVSPDPVAWGGLPVTPLPSGRVCWDLASYGSTPQSWAEIKAQPPFNSGLGGGMGADDLLGAELVGFKTFRAKAGMTLEGRYHLWYPATEANQAPLDLRYVILLNERQLTDAINDSPGEYYDITLRPGDEITLTLNIPPLTPGVHDLMVFGIPNVSDEPDPYGIIKLADDRISLLVEPISQDVIQNHTTLVAASSRRNGDPVFALEVGLDPNSLKIWNWPETRWPVSAGQWMDFYVYAGYQYAINVDAPHVTPPADNPFALFTFLDYRQVDVMPGTLVLYADADQDTAYARIPARIQAPTEPGRHDILLIRVDYPGVPMCLLQGPPDGRIFPYHPDAKRVAIEVVP